jgi:hypothetical protein
MKYKVKILKQPKYQDGGNMQQGADVQSQVIQIIKAYAEANDMDPQELVAKLKSLGEKEQQQAIAQMYQALQQSGGNQQEEDYAQEEMQPGMQQQMGYGEEGDEESDDMGMAAYGGQMGYGLDLGSRRLWMNQDNDEQSTVHRSIKEVPRNQANIEAEGGETALIPSGNDNTYSHFNIQGKRHTNGGVPLNVPEGTFIYSDTKKMKLGGSVLKVFGKSDKTSKKYTPAALAKQYDLNKYTAILENPNSSKLEKRTAELMIQNYNKKLAQLALVQEGKKGYPQGIPKVAEEYYAKTKAYVQSQQAKNQPQQKMQQQSNEDVDQNMEQPQAMYGMGFKYGGGLKRFQGDVDGSEYIPKEDNDLPTPPSNLVNNNQTPYEYDNSNIVENNEPQFEGWGDSRDSKTPSSFNYLGPSLTSNKLSTNYRLGMQDTPNYNDPTLSGIPLGMQKDKNYFDPNLYKLNYKKEEDKKEENKEEDYTNYKNNIKYGWTNPDKLNLAFALSNLTNVKMPTAFESSVKFQRPETRFYDSARELAANTEQYNAARQASAMFAGPQSRYSLNAGQYGKNAADIIAKTSNLNVQLGNAAASQAADITNKQIAYDAQRAKRLYDAGVIGEQQYQNAMRQARAGVLQAYTQGMRNAADLYNMSMSQSPYYAIDPKTQTIYFNSANARNRYFKDKAAASSGFGGYTKSQLEDASEAAGYGRKRDQVKEFLEDNAKMNAIQNRYAKANETGYGV